MTIAVDPRKRSESNRSRSRISGGVLPDPRSMAMVRSRRSGNSSRTSSATHPSASRGSSSSSSTTGTLLRWGLERAELPAQPGDAHLADEIPPHLPAALGERHLRADRHAVQVGQRAIAVVADREAPAAGADVAAHLVAVAADGDRRDLHARELVTHRLQPVELVLARPAADDLPDRLGAIFDTTDVNALWAVKVVSLDTGQVIFERNPRLLVMPASTMKVVTLAVAAERLGWDARFSTRLETTGAIEDGVLRGDLIVTGDGDPTIGEGEDASRVLDGWAGRLAMLGVTRIDGRLIGDDDVLPDQALGTGWAWDDLAFGYAAPVGALQFHEGSAQVVITAGPRAGTPASMRLEPASTDLVPQSRTRSGGISASGRRVIST